MNGYFPFEGDPLKLVLLFIHVLSVTTMHMQGHSQKSGEGGAVLLFDIARIRKGGA